MDLKIDQFNIYFWKEPDGEYGATTHDKPFDGISAFGDTKLEALKEFCTAMIGAIGVVVEDSDMISYDLKHADIPSYEYRRGEIKMTDLESKLMDVLMDFGHSIDSQGYDDGDYKKAIKKILKIIKGEW